MKAFLAALVAMVAIAFAANYGLSNAGFSSAEQYSGASVRLDTPDGRLTDRPFGRAE